MITQAANPIVLEVDGVRHESPSLEGVRRLLVELAREARDAKDARDKTGEQRRLLEARRRISVALLQLHTQVPHGRWAVLLREISDAVRLNVHTLRRCARLAAGKLVRPNGDWDPAAVREARRLLSETGHQTKSERNCALVRNLKTGSETTRPESKTNCALVRNLEEGPGGELSELEHGEFADEGVPVSMFEAERLTAVLGRVFDSAGAGNAGEGVGGDGGDVGDVGVFDLEGSDGADDDEGTLGVTGSQMTFEAEFATAKTVVDRLVDRFVSDEHADRAAAREVASTLRAAAARIEEHLGN